MEEILKIKITLFIKKKNPPSGSEAEKHDFFFLIELDSNAKKG